MNVEKEFRPQISQIGADGPGLFLANLHCPSGEPQTLTIALFNLRNLRNLRNPQIEPRVLG